LNSGDGFAGSVSSPNLPPGTYCIRLIETSGGDPNFAIDFAQQISTPEPSGLILLSAGLAALGLLRRMRA
jgi:hypothetical protein